MANDANDSSPSTRTTIDLANDSDQDIGNASDIEVLEGNAANTSTSTSHERLRGERTTKRARLATIAVDGRSGGSSAVDDVIVIDE